MNEIEKREDHFKILMVNIFIVIIIVMGFIPERILDLIFLVLFILSLSVLFTGNIIYWIKFWRGQRNERKEIKTL